MANMFTRNDLGKIAIDTTYGLNGPRHDADLAFPENFDFDDKAKASSWTKVGGQNGFEGLEWRGAFLPEQGMWPTQTFGVEIADPQVWSMGTDARWSLFYDVNLEGQGHGGWLGDDDFPGRNPFENNTRGGMTFTKVGSRHFRTQWYVDAIMGHFWAGEKRRVPSGHSAEIACGLIRITGQPQGTRMLGGIGADYYPVQPGQSRSTTNNDKAPGPGIQRYRYLSSEWAPFAWLTPTRGTAWSKSGLEHFIREYGLPEPAMLDRLPETLGSETPADTSPPIVIQDPPAVPVEPPALPNPPTPPEPTPTPSEAPSVLPDDVPTSISDGFRRLESGEPMTAEEAEELRTSLANICRTMATSFADLAERLGH